MMASAFVPNNEPQSQPILPSQRSPYFINNDRPVLQDQSWLPPPPPHPPPPHPSNLSFQPHLSRPPYPTSSPRGTMSALTPVHNAYPVHQQPRPYFTQGPSAMGYIPQQPRRYSRHQGLQEPIVPLRTEFSSWREIEQARPYSVPTHYTQPSQTMREYNASLLPPRPISVAHTNSQKLVNSDHPTGEFVSSRGPESRPLPSIPDTLNDSDAECPPRRLLPFPTNRQTKAQKPSAGKHSETTNKRSPSPKVVLKNTQKAIKRPAKKIIPPRKPAERSKKPATQQRKPPGKPPNPRKKPVPKRDASTPDIELPKRPTKIRFLGRFSNTRRNSSSIDDPITSPPEAKNKSPKAPPGQKSQKTPKRAAQPKTPSKPPSAEGKPPSESLDNGSTHEVEVPMRSGPTTRSLGRLYARRMNCSPMGEEREKPSSKEMDGNISPKPAHNSQKPGDSPPEVEVSSESVPPDTNASGSSEPVPSKTTTAALDDPLSVITQAASPQQVRKRSASQATTVSTASTDLAVVTSEVAASDGSAFNSSILMVDETMILERDVSNIINARLQQGEADLIETMYGEILIKMAIKDNDIFEGVAKTLESSGCSATDVLAM
ncbi:hypothetical protein GGR50DRAFT_383560 [Xylaria sp. CBS 124048]|nr:hypothetical protein GGR50DRAFT_383560 [Xylaria sp. CBS 124048]